MNLNIDQEKVTEVNNKETRLKNIASRIGEQCQKSSISVFLAPLPPKKSKR